MDKMKKVFDFVHQAQSAALKAARPGVACMVFSDEPGIYIGGEFGVRLEDDMHIADEGAELFTPPSSSLERPFGA